MTTGSTRQGPNRDSLERRSAIKIVNVTAVPLSGESPKGGWSAEIKPEDSIHTLIAVHTDAGITGYGSVFTNGGLVQAGLKVLEPLFLGENALEPERVAEKLNQNTFWMGRGGTLTHTISGIDIALWDVLGKVLGQPIGRLLGGIYRQRVQPYCSLLMEEPLRMHDVVAEFRDRGFHAGRNVAAFRISYVGEQGWELHMRYEDGLAVWDTLRSAGAIPVGIETYANTRRMEKSLRLQNADLLTEYNLLEADLARPKVKDADFCGKARHLEYRAREHQPAMLCTLVMTDNVDSKGVARYPVGTLPVMDPQTGETLMDELGRRSFTTSIAYGPSVGKNIALAYLPWAYAQQGRKLVVEYFGETYSVEVAAVGYKPLYDPENRKPRS